MIQPTTFNLKAAASYNLSANELFILSYILDLYRAGDDIVVSGKRYYYCHVPSFIDRLRILPFAGNGRRLAYRTVDTLFRQSLAYMEKKGLIERYISRRKWYGGREHRGTYLFIRTTPEVDKLISRVHYYQGIM